MILMTYNIMHGLDYLKLLQKERIIDLDKISQVIKQYNPDILALNEVYNDLEGINQAAYLAKKLGYKYYYFGKSLNLSDHLHYGNAILSKEEIINPETIKIEDVKTHDEDVYYESRIIIKAQIKDYNVFVSHFGLAKTEQHNAITKMKELIKNVDNIIFMGDLNIDEKEMPIIDNKLINTSEGKGLLTFPSINPQKKIDYIYISNNNKINDVKVGNQVASDHLPVIVNIN